MKSESRDVVYLVSRNPYYSFRWSLRSLANLPHRRVWLVGGLPNWVANVEHVPWRQGDKWQDLTDKFRALHTLDGLSDEFYYFEDDYYVLDPVEDLPHYVRPEPFSAKVGATGWGLSHRDTLRILEAAGFADPPSFEGHVPQVVEKDLIPVHLDPGGVPLRYKTMCGVHSSRTPVELVRDVKVRKHADLKDVLDKQVGFLSSAPNSFESSGVERLLRNRFPDPSPYEVV